MELEPVVWETEAGTVTLESGEKVLVGGGDVLWCTLHQGTLRVHRVEKRSRDRDEILRRH